MQEALTQLLLDYARKHQCSPQDALLRAQADLRHVAVTLSLNYDDADWQAEERWARESFGDVPDEEAP